MGEVLVVLSLLTCLLSLFFLRRRQRSRFPPGPTALPVIGNLHQLIGGLPHQSLHKLAIRHGPLMSLRFGSVRCVVASSAAAAKDLLKTHELSFSNRPAVKAAAVLSYGSNDFSFAPYGPYWRSIKKLYVTELLSSRTLDRLLPVRRKENLRFLRSLRRAADAGEAIDVSKELAKLANNVISLMTMGRRCSETDGEEESIRKIMLGTSELLGSFNLEDYFGFCKNLNLQGLDRRLEELHLRFDGMIEGIMREKESTRRKMGGGEHDSDIAKDLLDIMLDVYEDEQAEIKLSRENIKAFILDVFTAGTEPSALTTEWALAELINHPAVLQRARAEMDTVVGMSRLVEESDIPELPYLQAVVKETMRLHPAAPLIPRQSTKDCVVSGGYEIPAGTTLFVNLWSLGKDPSQWTEPLEFRPERFLEGAAVEAWGQHFQLLPFGTGRRRCSGMPLAIKVIQVALASMVQCFDWEECGPVDMVEGRGLTLQRACPLVCTPVARMMNPMSTA